jgi:hypothetical protein
VISPSGCPSPEVGPGQLLHHRDHHRDVNTPKVIGNGGWQAFSQLTYGGDKILYAVVSA